MFEGARTLKVQGGRREPLRSIDLTCAYGVSLVAVAVDIANHVEFDVRTFFEVRKLFEVRLFPKFDFFEVIKNCVGRHC